MANVRKPINVHDAYATVTAMSEGNIGAANVCMKLLEQGIAGFTAILDLDDMNMRGEQIWIAYKYHCGQSLSKLIELCRTRDKVMVDHVNREHTRNVAVIGGSSSDQAKLAAEADGRILAGEV